MTISTRPALDRIKDEQRSIIGPSAPPQIPKLTPVREREALYAMMLNDLSSRIAAETTAYGKRE